MLLKATIREKRIGAKLLLQDLELTLEQKERVAIIGRNGVGKTTLFNILSGSDDQFHGSIERRRGLRVVSTRQEHDLTSPATVVEYIRDNLPEYLGLKQVIDSYTAQPSDDLEVISTYSEALDRFGRLDYYNIEEHIVDRLATYQIGSELAHGLFRNLSGGQKRFAELVRVELSDADLALIDEPTNHMDMVAKSAFVEWLGAQTGSVVVITHDRDVLHVVDRIVEIKDRRAYSFPGNYDSYLIQNSATTVNAIAQYETAQRTMVNLRKQIAEARAKKPTWGGTADKKNPFVVLEERLTRELQAMERVTKPSFWIDQESVSQLSDKVVERYDRYKDKNIRLRSGGGDEHARKLLLVENLALGYDRPVFSGLSFELSSGDRMQILGRNGAGKTTLVRQIIAAYADQPGRAQVFAGSIKLAPKVKLGVYEQEIDPQLLQLELGQAVMAAYDTLGLPLDQEAVRRVLAEYLLDGRADYHLQVARLSGGQKARLQLIRMLAGRPNLLILDEPTNHLDLPSIEELENALQRYEGAILYISHDSYFARALGGTELALDN